MPEQEIDRIDKAKKIVADLVKRRIDYASVETGPVFEIYITSFTYILGGWKAWIGTTLPDKMMYEVTYNIEKKETYLDPYRKLENIVIPD